MELVFFGFSLALYLIAAASFATHLIVSKAESWRVALGVLAGAFAAHTIALAIHSLNAAEFAVTLFHDQLSVLAWMIVGLYLGLQIRFRLAVLGALVSPLAFLLTLSAYMFYSGVRELPRTLQSAWLPAHVAPAFLGYAIFAVAFCISLTYLVQEKQLKAKRKSAILRKLPSLEALDELNYRFVLWGFVLFTLGIITGSLLAKSVWGEFWSGEPVQIFSGIAWMLYALILQARATGWRGRRAAALTIAGFAFLLVSFFGVNLLFHGRHGGTLG